MMISGPGEDEVRLPMSIWADPTITILCSIFALILGAVFGSFLNCAAWRTANHESFLKGRSHCTSCGHELKAADLVPVLSWIFLKGRCRYCGEKISLRYPAAELVFALITLLCLLRFDLSAECLRNWVFFCCLFFLSMTDLECSTIPDGSLITAALAWLAALPFLRPERAEIMSSLLAAVIFAGGILLLSLLMDRILKKESLGGGDIKLFAVVGLYLGLAGTLFTVILACIIGLISAVLINKDGLKGKAFPFGPSISLAAGLMLLYGQGLIRWYLDLLGL